MVRARSERLGEEGEVRVETWRASEEIIVGRRRRRSAVEVSGGGAKTADGTSFWRRDGDVDVETNGAEEVAMLLEQAIGAESAENVVFDDGEGERRLKLLASCALLLTWFWIHGERDGRSVCVL